jgi:hypothetical protein
MSFSLSPSDTHLIILYPTVLARALVSGAAVGLAVGIKAFKN